MSRVTEAGGRGPQSVVARPGLSRRLTETKRVAAIAAPAGSGKTMLLRSWIEESGLGDRVAWVAAGSSERDPQRFWVSVFDALRRTGAGAPLVPLVSAAPDADGWALVERLLTALAPLREPLWLVVDDVHELGPAALRQLELLVLRAASASAASGASGASDLRFVLASRHDVRLGLHRLRLEGGLVEIRAADLRFSLAEARRLFTGAGLDLPEPAAVALHERTEGWAAGLRMAAMSLAGHPDPERFAAEFSGSERTVAEYLLVEVLERQREDVRRLLLRTSILEWVNGELAELLSGVGHGERVLQDLEEAGAFVLALDSDRTRFRYHPMFAELLALELRRAVPGEVAGLHRTASGWFAAHGRPLEAIRHAQAARDWDQAAQLLVSHWPGLYLDGQDAAVHELLAGFPGAVRAGDAELAAVAAADELTRGSLKAAEHHLNQSERAMASMPAQRRDRADLLLGIVRLLTARQRGDLDAELQQAQRLRTIAEHPQASRPSGPARPASGEELRAVALIGLGYASSWSGGPAQTRHLEEGIALARRIGRPYLEFTGLAYKSAIEATRLAPEAETSAARAIELAESHGWTDKVAVGVASVASAGAVAWQGRLDEAEAYLRRAGLTIGPEVEAVAALAALFIRGQLELVRGRAADAFDTFQTAETLAGHLAGAHPFARPVRAWSIRALIRLGELARAEQSLAEIDEPERDSGLVRVVAATLRLARDDPRGALAELGPALDTDAHAGWRAWLVEAFLLEALARDALGERAAAGLALERALEQAEAGSTLLCFLLHPVAELVERHARGRTSHARVVGEVRTLLGGGGLAARGSAQKALVEALSDSEIRVLRYLPTNLTAPQIGDELSVSRNTVKTHMRSLYTKLDTHSRAETVARARELGLIARVGLVG
ncbi:AAA family ATPase [Catenulispora sp. NL8]|uniref:AAA family ATPase n=1 Tax=Catenulispora pinistramenti TaxID=2705254 RepID=A0ABS5L1B5_9ACTN|nr:LuxR C-terminal-related transcriptional regulator [Catenulispora pinistramenti]MBS2552111.1 AAA family ATPase [Catenulispora pinistramenti]